MKSIYQEALGEDFELLHPAVQQRLGISSDANLVFKGSGTMNRVRNGGLHTLPVLAAGKKHNILFPYTGENIPFTIENYAYKDSMGREAVAWIRTFQFGDKKANFDATMVYSKTRNKIIDYLGKYHRIIVDINIAAEGVNGFKITTGNQRLLPNKRDVKIPEFFAGNACVTESYNEATNEFNIKVNVTNKYFGFLFGYEGVFTPEYQACTPNEIPGYAKPLRVDARE